SSLVRSFVPSLVPSRRADILDDDGGGLLLRSRSQSILEPRRGAHDLEHHARRAVVGFYAICHWRGPAGRGVKPPARTAQRKSPPPRQGRGRLRQRRDPANYRKLAAKANEAGGCQRVPSLSLA